MSSLGFEQIVGLGFERVVRDAPVAIAVIEASGRVIYSNGRARELTGRQLGREMPADLDGAIDIFYPDGRRYERREWPAVRSLTSGEEIVEEEFFYGLLGGGRLFIRCSCFPVRDEDGEIIAAVLAMGDVTEHKVSEEALRESRRRSETILESITDEFIAFDEEWGYSYVNEGALRAINNALRADFSRDDLIGKTVWDLFPEFADSALYVELDAGRREGRAVHVESYSEIADRWVEVHAYPSDGGLTAYTRDITERKRAEEQLTYHASLLDIAEDAVVGVDTRFRVTVWSRGAERLFGFTADEVLGRHARDVASYEGDTSRLELECELLEGGRTHIEITAFRKDGRPVEVELIGVAVRDGQGAITGYLGVHRDITLRKRLEREQQRLAAIAQNSSDFVGISDLDGGAVFLNEAGQRLVGLQGMEQVRQTEMLDYFAPEDRAVVRDELLPAVLERGRWAGERFEDREIRLRHFQTGASIPVFYDVFRLDDPRTGEPFGLGTVTRDISERKRAEEERASRARQQAVVADLGLRALASDDLQPLMDEAVGVVARTLAVELVAIAELLSGGEELVLRAGVGWEEGAVGNATGPAGRGSLVGYMVMAAEPVISEDVRADERFRISPFLSEHEPLSALAVVIAGREGPFGCLGAFSKQRHSFSEHDVNFMQAVANVLATAVERAQGEEKLHQVREAERGRIARELHDEALQELTDALVQADRGRSAGLDAKTAERLVSTLKRVGQQLRGAVYDLRLGDDEDRAFPERLKELVEVHRELAIDCEMHLEIGAGVPAGPLGRTATEVLRIVGAALVNARRHSGARHVGVSATGSQAQLRVKVSDDGRGFDPAAAPSGGGAAGITGMKERAALLDADLDIRSGPGTGTQVRLELPLSEGHAGSDRKTRVLLVEDHAAVREAIAEMFEREPDFEVVGQAASLAESRSMLEGVDIAIVDLGLPDGWGGDLIEELREHNPRAQALVLSASLDRAEIARAIQSGAAGTLDKSAHLAELVDSARRLRAGETLIPLEEVVELLSFAGQQREQERTDLQAIESLTRREREVLQLLAEGLDSQAIADRLHITLRTQRNHVANILTKLDVHSQLQAVVFALRYNVVKIR